MARLCTQAWFPCRSATDSDQPVNDEDDGDDSDDPDEDDNNDDNDAPASSSQSLAVPETPEAPVSLPATVISQAPVAAPKSPRLRPLSKSPSRLERLRTVA